jgi:TMEM199 family protein
MERLRRDEEARAYDRMLNPPPKPETFAQRFAASPHSRVNPIALDFKDEEEEMTYADINRQLTLIINILVSIIACSVAIWIGARHWSTPKRLGLSMTGSGVVAIAEVVIYNGYITRLKEAKQKERKKVEVKKISDTWIIKPTENTGKQELISNKSVDNSVRNRKGKHR